MPNYMFYDDETCGNCGIICQIGFVLTDSKGNVLKTFESLINPHHSFDYYVTKYIHGISQETVKDAPDFLDVWKNHVEPNLAGAIFVAHSAKTADLHHIRKSFKRAGAKRQIPTIQVIDTFDMAHNIDMPKRGLAALAERYGIKEDHHHDALDDADVLRQVFFEMRKETEELPPFSWSGQASAQTQTKLPKGWLPGPNKVLPQLQSMGKVIDQSSLHEYLSNSKHPTVVIAGKPNIGTKSEIDKAIKRAGYTTANYVTPESDLIVIMDRFNHKMFPYVVKSPAKVTSFADFAQEIALNL